MEDLPERERPSRYKRPTRINLTDKDARLMQARQGVVPGYNAQAMVSPLAEEGGTAGMLAGISHIGSLQAQRAIQTRW